MTPVSAPIGSEMPRARKVPAATENSMLMTRPITPATIVVETAASAAALFLATSASVTLRISRRPLLKSLRKRSPAPFASMTRASSTVSGVRIRSICRFATFCCQVAIVPKRASTRCRISDCVVLCFNFAKLCSRPAPASSNFVMLSRLPVEQQAADNQKLVHGSILDVAEKIDHVIDLGRIVRDGLDPIDLNQRGPADGGDDDDEHRERAQKLVRNAQRIDELHGAVS